MKNALVIFILTWATLGRAEKLFLAVPADLAQTPPFVELKDYVAAALAKEDIQVEYLPLSIDRSTFMVEKGEVDGELVRAERMLKRSPKYIMTSFPIAYSDFKVIHRKQIKDFNEDKLEYYTGVMFFCAVVTREALANQKAKVVIVENVDHVLMLLENGRADYTVLPDPIIASSKAQNAKAFDNLVIGKKSLDRTALHFYLRKNKSYLMPKVEKALKKASHEPLDKYRYLPAFLNTKIP